MSIVVNKLEDAGLKILKILKLSLNNSNDTDNIHENIGKHNRNKNRKTLIVFDDMMI